MSRPSRTLLVAALLLPGCQPDERPLTIGVSFETLKAELAKRNIRAVTAVADGDASRQLEQVNSFLIRR